MSMNSENQAICCLAAAIGQFRPRHDPADIAKAAAKLYRISVSLQNRGVFDELVRRARAIALSLDGHFTVEEDGADRAGACSLRLNPVSEIRIV